MKNSDYPKQDRVFSILKNIAENNEPVSKQRLAAALYIKNELIATGFNKRKSHPFQKKFAKNKDSIFLHAEIDCIINALKSIHVDDLRGSTMYIARVKKTEPKKKCKHNNKFIQGLAKPCIGCAGAIAQFGIATVYYTTDGGDEFDML